jgi:hypothetical protein
VREAESLRRYAEVIFDFGLDEPTGPAWLRSVAGAHLFNEAVTVNMFPNASIVAKLSASSLAEIKSWIPE